MRTTYLRQASNLRDFSAKVTNLKTTDKDGTASGNETDDQSRINLHGKSAKMHQPLQNHDQDYLSNFITQMYQTTAIQYPNQAKKDKQEEKDAGYASGFKVIEEDGTAKNQASDQVDMTLDKEQVADMLPADQLDSKTATVKFEKNRNSTGEHTGRHADSKFVEDSA